MKTFVMCHNQCMDTQTKQMEEAGISEDDQYPFVKGIVPGTMSGAEMLAYWPESGCFEVWADQYKTLAPARSMPTA